MRPDPTRLYLTPPSSCGGHSHPVGCQVQPIVSDCHPDPTRHPEHVLLALSPPKCLSGARCTSQRRRAPRWWVASPSVSVGLPLGMGGGEGTAPCTPETQQGHSTGSMHSTDVTGNEGARVAESWSPRPAQDYCTGGGGVQRGLLPCYSAPHSTAQ